ncbi:copine-8 [Gracilaria domingensis]|nr:copine-8 [Gracilaria domingensis]
MVRGEKTATIGNQLEIQIEASNLANMDVFSLSDPFALLEEQENGAWEEIGRTETIWDVLNPKWVRTFVLPAETPLGHLLRVTIYDRDSKTQNLDKQEVIGSCLCRVEEIIKEGSNGKTLELENKELKETGSVTIIGELYDPKDTDHEIFLGNCKFRNNSFFGMFLIRPYIVIYRRRANNEWAPIFRSSSRKRGEDAAFSEDLLHRAKLRTHRKGGNVEETPLRIELRSHKSITEHKLIGAVQMSLGSLRRQGVGKKISLGLAGESVGELIVTRATLADNSSSFDFEVSFRS